MAVAIRFARIGKKKAPFFRIVAISSRKQRDGEFLENLGTYNPLTGEVVQLNEAKVQEWIGKGAIPSESFLKVQKRYNQITKKAAGITVEANTSKAAPKAKKITKAAKA